MKTFTSLLKIILLAGLFLYNNPIFSQGKFEISGGIAWPEAINLKIKYGNVFQIGVSQGMPFHGLSHYWGSSSLQFYYHFGEQSKYINQPVWYVSGGVDCIYTSPDGNGNTWLPLLRIGRTINFSKRFGLCMDGGIAFLDKSNSEFFNSPVLPSGSICFFFRL